MYNYAFCTDDVMFGLTILVAVPCDTEKKVGSYRVYHTIGSIGVLLF